MRSIILSAILALASLCANAAPLPSSITGAYLTPERVCRLELYRNMDPRWTLIDLQCLRIADGLHTSLLANVFTLTQTGLGCPDGGSLALPFDPRLIAEHDKAGPVNPNVLLYVDGQWRPMPMLKSGGEHFTITAFGPDRVDVRVGIDPSALLNGGGIAQTWWRQPQYDFASRAPYSCGGALRFRVFGR